MLQVSDPVKVVKEMFEYASDEIYSNDGTSGEKQKNTKGMCRERTFTGECSDESE